MPPYAAMEAALAALYGRLSAAGWPGFHAGLTGLNAAA
jgi:hypothetical protein